MKLRTGRHNKQLVYVQKGDEPSDNDRLFAVFFDPKDAALVVRWEATLQSLDYRAEEGRG